jgi:zinc transport system substrate-binding protein
MKYTLFIALAAIITYSSCNTQSMPVSAKTISVTMLPQKYFVEAIAGDRIKVNVMIPPGASHSSYEPTARQMNLLSHSGSYFKIGYLDFERAWLPRFEGINPDMQIFDLSEGVELLKGSCEHIEETDNSNIHKENENGIDPHIWMSPVNVKIIAANILKSLSTLYPEDSGVFRANYSSFLVQINEVDSLYKIHAEELKGLSFIIYHPALAYLAKDYGMEQIVLEFDGKEPPPAHIKKIIDTARDKNIHVIFVQKQISIDNSRSLAGEINAKIIAVDPLDENWKDQMISILGNLLDSQNSPDAIVKELPRKE